MVLVEEGDCFLAAEEMDNFLLSVCEREGGTGESFWVGKQGNRKEGILLGWKLGAGEGLLVRGVSGWRDHQRKVLGVRGSSPHRRQKTRR